MSFSILQEILLRKYCMGPIPHLLYSILPIFIRIKISLLQDIADQFNECLAGIRACLQFQLFGYKAEISLWPFLNLKGIVRLQQCTF